MTEIEQIEKEIQNLKKKQRELRKCKRAALIKPFSIERAVEMDGRVRSLGRRFFALGRTLRRRCPHDWVVTKNYNPPDCDGMFGGWAHYRTCSVCQKHESLPVPKPIPPDWGSK